MALIAASKARPAEAFDRSASSAIASTNSFLFTCVPLGRFDAGLGGEPAFLQKKVITMK
jgi:hypothetical protein